jgi:UDP-N-acetylglucosamine 3-dehydrogenase
MEIRKFAVLGFGNIGYTHAQNIIEHPNALLTSIYSRSPKDNVPQGVNFYNDYEELIKLEDLDAVVIATPTFTHEKIACLCAENGLDIFLEKPMALTLEECDHIISAAYNANVKLFVGHVLRFWPSYFHVRNFVKSSKSTIGDIMEIEAKRLSTFPWSDWFADESKSGGVILDLSIHDLDYANWILGYFISISCKAKRIKQYGMKVYGKSITTLKFEKEKKAKIEASWAEKPDFPLTTYANIKGTEGNIEFNGEGIFEGYPIEIIEPLESYDGYYNEITHFIDCIINRDKNLAVNGEDGKISVAICLAAIESANNKGKEVFFDDFLKK